MEKLTRYVYLAFVIIAIVLGLVAGYLKYANDPSFDTVNGGVTLILLILGIIAGLVSITEKEVTPFLICAIALLAAAASNVWEPLKSIHEVLYWWATIILNYIVAFAAPAAVITAVRSLLPLVKEK